MIDSEKQVRWRKPQHGAGTEFQTPEHYDTEQFTWNAVQYADEDGPQNWSPCPITVGCTQTAHHYIYISTPQWQSQLCLNIIFFLQTTYNLS